MKPTIKKSQLNSLVETMEFTLISVIQGVALYFFINDTKDTILTFRFEYWVYVLIAFIVLSMFWSQALVHVMSFISWPLEFVHMFLYFLVVTFEVLLFENITNPSGWFFWNIFFFACVGLLYFVDFNLLRSKKSHFEHSELSLTFYSKLIIQQKIGLYFLVPSGITFSFVAWLLLTRYPNFYFASHGHLIFGFLQLGVALVVLVFLLRTFKSHFGYIEAIREMD